MEIPRFYQRNQLLSNKPKKMPKNVQNHFIRSLNDKTLSEIPKKQAKIQNQQPIALTQQFNLRPTLQKLPNGKQHFPRRPKKRFIIFRLFRHPRDSKKKRKTKKTNYKPMPNLCSLSCKFLFINLFIYFKKAFKIYGKSKMFDTF